MTVQSELVAAKAATHDVYAQVQQFYAHQMQRLDFGEAHEWAKTFTEDAVFEVPTLPAPVRGRYELAAAARRAAAANRAAGERHRHFVGMLDVVDRHDGRLDVSAYTVVYASRLAGGSWVHRVCVCMDALVRREGRLLVESRRVTRDDQP